MWTLSWDSLGFGDWAGLKFKRRVMFFRLRDLISVFFGLQYCFVLACKTEESQTVRLKAQKVDLGGCRKFSDEIFETGFQKQRLKLNLESAFMFPEKYREGRFWGTS